MKETVWTAALSAMLLLPIAPQRTAPPVTSFAGTWTGDITRNASARYVGGLGFERESEGFTIAQEAKTLAVTRTHVVVDTVTSGSKTIRWTRTYRLDGAESPNSGFYFQHT